jgi:molecular chaperone DnaK
LRELGDKVPSAERSSIETKVNELKQAAQGDDVDKIKKLTENYRTPSTHLSQQMYAQGNHKANLKTRNK